MFDSLLLQITGQAVVTSAWNFFDAIALLFMTVSGIALFLALKLKKVLENSTNPKAKALEKILNEYVIPMLGTGREFIQNTKTQEGEIKQIGEILYSFMGSAADKITDKELVQLETLRQNILKMNTSASDYDKKLQELLILIEKLRGQGTVETPVPIQ